MQIDLANTLVHKAYFVYHALFIIARKLALPSFGGVGGGFSPSPWERGPGGEVFPLPREGLGVGSLYLRKLQPPHAFLV